MTELIASAAKRDAARIGALAGLVAGPVFLASVGLNTWASLDYLHGLEWEFVGGEEVPWPSSLARGPHAWEQIATFVVTGLLVVLFAFSLRDNLPRRRAGSFAAALLGVLGAALMLAAFRVDVPMLRGEDPETWNGWAHGIGFLAIIATGGRSCCGRRNPTSCRRTGNPRSSCCRPEQ